MRRSEKNAWGMSDAGAWPLAREAGRGRGRVVSTRKGKGTSQKKWGAYRVGALFRFARIRRAGRGRTSREPRRRVADMLARSLGRRRAQNAARADSARRTRVARTRIWLGIPFARKRVENLRRASLLLLGPWKVGKSRVVELERRSRRLRTGGGAPRATRGLGGTSYRFYRITLEQFNDVCAQEDGVVPGRRGEGDAYREMTRAEARAFADAWNALVPAGARGERRETRGRVPFQKKKTLLKPRLKRFRRLAREGRLAGFPSGGAGASSVSAA
jgi:hypothetical protein